MVYYTLDTEFVVHSGKISVETILHHLLQFNHRPLAPGATNFFAAAISSWFLFSASFSLFSHSFPVSLFSSSHLAHSTFLSTMQRRSSSPPRPRPTGAPGPSTPLFSLLCYLAGAAAAAF
jgi:hypothetical protein